MTRSNDILQVRVSFPVTLSLTSLRAAIARGNFFDAMAVYCENKRRTPKKGKTLPKSATFSTHCGYQIRSPRQFQVESFEKRLRIEGFSADCPALPILETVTSSSNQRIFGTVICAPAKYFTTGVKKTPFNTVRFRKSKT